MGSSGGREVRRGEVSAGHRPGVSILIPMCMVHAHTGHPGLALLIVPAYALLLES